jgi:hypothetical protein
MNIFSYGVITMLNGMYQVIAKFFSPLSLIILVLAISICWFFLIELDEYNRSGSKPNVGRH